VYDLDVSSDVLCRVMRLVCVMFCHVTFCNAIRASAVQLSEYEEVV